MKEYSYFIPGYTGFCPELREHYGKTYGYATRHVIQKKPHLKERLAPVRYRYQRYENINGTLGKYLQKEQDKNDYPISRHRTGHLYTSEPKHLTDYHVVDTVSDYYHLDYEDGDIRRRKCYRNFENVYPPRMKCTSTSAHDDEIRKIGHEYTCPKYVFIQGYAECVQPEMWPSKDKRKIPHERYSCVVTPCTHVREHSVRENYMMPKKCSLPRPNIHLDGYHPADCGHRKDAKFDTDCKMRKGQRVKPDRQGGVIPKYTGHIPGMQFSFGESYGPITDRLLQKHHNRMKAIKIKS